MGEDGVEIGDSPTNSHTGSPEKNIIIDLKPDGSYTVEDQAVSEKEPISEPTVDRPPVIIDAEQIRPTDRNVVEAQIRATHPNWSEKLIEMATNDTISTNRILNLDIKRRSGRK